MVDVTSRATRSSIRRPSAPGRTSRGTTGPAAGRRCSGPRARTPASRPAGRGSGCARTPRRGTSRPSGRDPDSTFAAYRRLLAFRRAAPALRTGAMERLDSGTPDVLAWTREAGGQRLLTVVSFVGEPRTVDLGRMTGSAGWIARVGQPPRAEPAGRLAAACASGPTRP